jgi:SAM-dependent methyltransferase
MSAASPQPSLFTTQSDFGIRFPDGSDDLDQDEEWFEFKVDGRSRKLRIHDYAELYEVPGLYEALVYDKLACRSPQRLAKLFASVLTDAHVDARDLRVLDLGAGNGIVAGEFGKLGACYLVGLDLLREAELAAQRDRPGLYADYLVADLSRPRESDIHRLEQHQLNCLVTVSSLGFGDIPPESFATALNSITSNGWLGVTIKEEFLNADEESGFGRLIKALIDQQIMEIQAHQRYCHRLSITGDRLFYVAVVARKTRDIPASLLDNVNDRSAAAINDNEGADHTGVLLGTEA